MRILNPRSALESEWVYVCVGVCLPFGSKLHLVVGVRTKLFVRHIRQSVCYCVVNVLRPVRVVLALFWWSVSEFLCWRSVGVLVWSSQLAEKMIEEP